MTNLPLIMSAPMVHATLREVERPGSGKTETRRILKPQPPKPEDFSGSVFGLCPDVADGVKMYSLNDYERLPKHPTKWRLDGSVGVARAAGFPTTYNARYAAGDRLWVRENLRRSSADGETWTYAADDAVISMPAGDRRIPAMIAWAHHEERDSVPSIHMPRIFSRLTLVVRAVKIERLQDISEEDAIAEGIRQMRDGSGTWVSREGPGNLVTPWPTAREAFADLWQSLHGCGSWNANPYVVAITFQPHLCNIDAMAEAA